MVERALLDTDILSEVLKGKDRSVLRSAEEYAFRFGKFTYTAVSVLEILYGLHYRDARRQLELAKRSFLENELIVPTLEDYHVAGRIRGEARKQGSQLTSDDCLIGAAAARLGLPVVTGNIEHFRSIQRAGLAIRLLNWRESPDV